MHSATRRALLAAPLLAWPALASFPARAQPGWPTQPVKVVLPQGPGSGSDVLMRMLGGFLSRELGQSVVVENRTGGGGIIGHESVLRPPFDGHTFLFTSTAGLFVAPLVNAAAKYRFGDFVPVAAVNRAPFAVLVPNTPAAPKTLKELLDSLRAKPQAFSSSGTGTMTHLGGELLLKRAGLQATHIPYRGSGQSLADLMGGQVAFSVDSLTAAVPLIKGGRLRALAVLSPQREASLPDVPAIGEAGYPDVQVAVLGGLFAAKETPKAAIDRMATETAKVLREPEVRQRMAAVDTEPLLVSPAAFADMLRRDGPQWEQLVKQLDIKAE